jgi:hypothetical protein
MASIEQVKIHKKELDALNHELLMKMNDKGQSTTLGSIRMGLLSAEYSHFINNAGQHTTDEEVASVLGIMAEHKRDIAAKIESIKKEGS